MTNVTEFTSIDNQDPFSDPSFTEGFAAFCAEIEQQTAERDAEAEWFATHNRASKSIVIRTRRGSVETERTTRSFHTAAQALTRRASIGDLAHGYGGCAVVIDGQLVDLEAVRDQVRYQHPGARPERHGYVELIAKALRSLYRPARVAEVA